MGNKNLISVVLSFLISVPFMYIWYTILSKQVLKTFSEKTNLSVEEIKLLGLRPGIHITGNTLDYKKFPVASTNSQEPLSLSKLNHRMNLVDWLVQNNIKISRSLDFNRLYHVKNNKLYISRKLITKYGISNAHSLAGLFLHNPEIFSRIVEIIGTDTSKYYSLPFVGVDISKSLIRYESVMYLVCEEESRFIVLNYDTLEEPDSETLRNVISKYRILNR